MGDSRHRQRLQPGYQRHVVAQPLQQRLIEMRVGVDQAGKEMALGRVDSLRSGVPCRHHVHWADGRNALALHCDRTGRKNGVVGIKRRDASRSDEQISCLETNCVHRRDS